MQESSSPTLPHVIAFLVELTRVLDCFPCSVYCPTVVWQTQGGKQMLAKWKWLPQWIFLPVTRFSPLIRILFLGPCREDATFLESGILIVNVKGIDTNGWFGNIMIGPKIIIFIVILSGERLFVQLLLWPPFHHEKPIFISLAKGVLMQQSLEPTWAVSAVPCVQEPWSVLTQPPITLHGNVTRVITRGRVTKSCLLMWECTEDWLHVLKLQKIFCHSSEDLKLLHILIITLYYR